MPGTTDLKNYTDDDNEFLIEGQDKPVTGNYNYTQDLPSDYKPRASLLRLAENSRLSKIQRDKFLSAVELDLLRHPDEKLNLQPLFEASCRNGSVSWLNPVDSIRKLDQILEKFACMGKDRGSVLTPLIVLLTELAGRGINPRAFLDYVILPRISEDNDWRKWNERHMEALKIIADFLVSMKRDAPFNREHLGTGKTKLVRDIVLVKYVGKPLAAFPLIELRDKDLLERYRAAWQRLRIDNAFTILFMKTNILHFMYTMSGRIDFIQLVAIIENMPEIEEGFRENFPDSCFNIDVTRIDMNLYDYDMSKAVYDRRQKGFTSYDFVVEIKSYLSIILALLGTGSGIYLCGYFARRLSAAKNPDTARLFERLIRTVRDDGGKTVYTWHARRMLAFPGAQRDAYIDMVQANNGKDPAYPDPDMYFNGAELGSYDLSAFETMLNTLGLAREDFDSGVIPPAEEQKQSPVSIPYHAWIKAYTNRYPERKRDIDRYREEVARGSDRTWDRNRVDEIDSIGLPLHGPLLQSVIPGLSGGMARHGTVLKSGSFRELMARYGEVASVKSFSVSHDFSIPLRDFESFDRFRNAEIRKQVNTAIINQVWRYVEDTSIPSAANVTYYVNGEFVKIREPLAERQQDVLKIKDALSKMNDSASGRAELEKKASSVEKAVLHMKRQTEEFESLLREIEFMSEREKILSALIVAARLTEPGDDFAVYTIRLLIERYAGDMTLRGRLNHLRADVAIDLIHLRQLEMLVETIDGLARLVAADRDFDKAFNSDADRAATLNELLGPFILLKTRKLSMEALDAAVRRLTGFAKLTAERARWQELHESFQNRDTRYFEPFRIYPSRAIIDAYYGDMGSICLSGIPEAINDPSLHVIRLASDSELKIKGIALMYRSAQGLSTYMKKAGPFWHSFAYNPLPSFLHHLTRRQQLYLYLNYRRVIEDVSRLTGLPVVLSGINSWSIISNDRSFAELILSLEKRFNAAEVDDARGLSLLYAETSYSEAMVIIDPSRPDTFRSEKLLANFKWDIGSSQQGI